MRLIIVSNRLPVTAKVSDGKIEFESSVGGLASGLRSYLETAAEFEDGPESFVWVGWLGATIPPEFESDLRDRAQKEHHAVPVYLSEEDMEKFYFGFCNRTLWALFHYFPSYTSYEEAYWENYKKVNRAFCDSLDQIIQPGDVVWVHDYHLLLLPRLLRERFPDNPIAFFLHIPFPSYEIFRLLPSRWREELLNGMLGADLVGFHTHDYVQDFLRCVTRCVRAEHNLGVVRLRERMVKVESFPMGIDYKKFHDAASSLEVQAERDTLRSTIGNAQIVFSLDRLDYSKGILNRLLGYQRFLDEHPEWRGKVVLVIVVIPSRVGVEHYDLMKKNIDEMVGRINGQFAKIGWTPVVYQFRTLPFAQLVGLYSESSVMLVTPLRDGMNLIAKEFVASRVHSDGVLILSEMAGAAKELGEALVINPNSVQEIADAISEALHQGELEQHRRIETMQRRLKRYTVVRWATDFLDALMTIRSEQSEYDSRFLTSALREGLVNDYAIARKRLILLDYDGTLVPFSPLPELAKPSAEALRVLETLAGDKRNDVVIISGRDRNTLQDWLGKLSVLLVAEHGVWTREQSGVWRLSASVHNEWRPQILALCESFSDRLPRSFVEQKDYSVAFHYRQSDSDLASLRVKELKDHILHLTANTDVQVIDGNKVLEVRCAGIHKGNSAMQFFVAKDYDFVLAAGDDMTDEDLFRALPESVATVKIGRGGSHAKYNLPSHTALLGLLREFGAKGIETREKYELPSN